jgi:hypothetical protein
VTIGAAELAQHEAVEAVGLAGRGAEAIARGGELVGMDREHRDAGGQRSPDPQPVGTLDRHARDGVLEQRRDQRGHAALVVREARGQQPRSVLVGDVEVMPLGSPIDPAHCAHAWSSPVEVASRQADREVPWRVLIDRPSMGRHPVAALGASHRREALVSCGPSQRLASTALSRRWSALCAPQYQGRPSLRSGLFSLSRKEKENTPVTALAGREVVL